MNVPAPIRTAAALLTLALLAMSCSMLPDDHAFVRVLGQSARRMTHSVGSVSRAFESGGRDLNVLAAKIAAAPEAASRELGRVGHATATLTTGTTDRFTRFPGRTMETVRQSVAGGVRRVGRLRSAPARVGLSVERNLAALRGAAVGAPRALDLDDTPMAEANDPERTVEVVPTGRRRSWLERALDRIAF